VRHSLENLFATCNLTACSLLTDQEDDVGEGSLPTPTASNSEMHSSPRSNADTTARDEANQPHTAGFLPPSAEDDEEREVEQMDEFTTVNGNNHEHDVFESRPNEVEVQQETSRSYTEHTRTVGRGEGTPNHQKFKPVLKPSAASAADGMSFLYVIAATIVIEPHPDNTPTLHVKKEKDATANRSMKGKQSQIPFPQKTTFNLASSFRLL
jgi:hypothetical protein